MEAIFGQLYLITVVALVVQNLGQKTRLGRKMEEQLEETAEQTEGDASTDSATPVSGAPDDEDA